MQPTERRIDTGRIELTCFEWGAEHRGRAPTLLLVHATGFHARCWDPVVRRLGEHHVIAVDQRGHGRSEKTEIESWDVFGDDLAAFVRKLGLQGVVGVGHSMGAHALVDAAAAEPAAFRNLVLVDPVIASPDAYGAGGWTISNVAGGQHPTARRKRHFDSPEEMIERFKDRMPYRVFLPEALEAYCRFGLLPSESGEGFDLACPPEIEASIYMTSRTNAGIHDSVRAIDVPVLILRAKLPAPDREVMDFSSSPTWPELVGEFPNARDLHFHDRTHFLPMEIPGRIADLILHEVERPGAPLGRTWVE
jgi:pimeloyl-ACP methyl ester carboxylesterase